jgi:hypothetical protein
MGVGRSLERSSRGELIQTPPYSLILESPQFDSLVQTATGFNHAEAEAYYKYSHPGEPLPYPLSPRPFPYQALDYTGGYLLAFGIITALCKAVTVRFYLPPLYLSRPHSLTYIT